MLTNIVRLVSNFVPHEDEVLSKRQFFLLFHLLISVIVIIGNDHARHLEGGALHRERHLSDVDACIDELALFGLGAIWISTNLKKLTVTHREAKHLFLHFFGHALVKKVLLRASRWVNFLAISRVCLISGCITTTKDLARRTTNKVHLVFWL